MKGFRFRVQWKKDEISAMIQIKGPCWEEKKTLLVTKVSFPI